MTMAEKTARFMLLLIFVVAFLSLMWAEILYYASATAVSTPVSSTDAIFDICLVNRECSQRFFISEDTAYDRAVFADLWTQRVRKPNKDEWNAQALDVFYAICGFQPTFDNVTQSPAAAQWPTPECVANVIALSDSSPPCGVNEKYMLNVGCRCPAGKVCPKDIDSDGVGVRQSDRLFVRIALGAIILFVLGGAYILLERSQRTHNAVTGERAHQE